MGFGVSNAGLRIQVLDWRGWGLGSGMRVLGFGFKNED